MIEETKNNCQQILCSEAPAAMRSQVALSRWRTNKIGAAQWALLDLHSGKYFSVSSTQDKVAASPPFKEAQIDRL